ncbi:MAG: type 4a pilus biogenesis protein PilO, partial [Desulfobulbaceae bacterium]|nr:type 4a pilus biogenesis protein PilO [Desulfobulbaceae bacterium]
PLSVNHKVAIALAALIVPAALFYFLYFSPKRQEIIALEASVTQLQQQIAEVKVKAAKLDEQKALMADIEKKFKEAALVIPDTKEIPSLLSSISGEGSRAGLDILSFVPGAEAVKGFYAEIPVALSVNGTYHNVGYFLDTVSKLPRIVNVSKVLLGSPKLTDGEMLVDAKLDLVTYKFIEPVEAAKNNATKK